MAPIPVDITFSDHGIFPGMTISARYKDQGLHPRQFKGVVESVFPRFALITTEAGYQTTIHITDVACKIAKISVC